MSFHCCSFNFIVFFSGLPEPSFITPSVLFAESARCKSLRLIWIQNCNTLHLHWIVCCWHHRRRYFRSQGRNCYLQVTAIHLGLGSVTTFTCCTSLAAGALSATWASPSALSLSPERLSFSFWIGSRASVAGSGRSICIVDSKLCSTLQPAAEV